MFQDRKRHHCDGREYSLLLALLTYKLIISQGSAADAMVSTTLCVGVIGMYHSGIGGGGFMLVRDKHGKYETIDYRETAPAAASQDMYKQNPNASVYGGLAVAVPSELKGLDHLHRKYGVRSHACPSPAPQSLTVC